MINKSPSRYNKMAASGIWSLEGTPGILEVHELQHSLNTTNDEDNYLTSVVDDVIGADADRSSASKQNEDDDALLSRAAVASKLLATLEDFNYDDETDQFSDLLFSEEKSIFPYLYEDPNINVQTPSPVLQQPYNYNTQKCGYESSPTMPPLVPVDNTYPQQQNQFYIQQQSPVWPTVDVMNSTQLTPPHSPCMYEMKPKICSDEDLPKNDIYSTNLQQNQEVLNSECVKEENNLIIDIFDNMNAKDIDELVRSHVPDIIAPSESNNSYAGYLSPENTSGSETMSDYHSDYSSDPDYSPFSPEYARKTTKNTSTSNIGKITKKTERSAAQRKPYSRKNGGVIIEDKKMRKKEQNKNAATRYRLKKKAEIEEILGEEKELEDKNENLKKQVEDLAREVKFIKNLIKECKSKRIL